MKKATILNFFIWVFFFIASNVPLHAAAPITLSWADYVPPDDDRCEYYRYYIQRIKEETNGRVEIKFYPAEQLVKALQQYEALMQGTIDMCGLVPVYYGGKIPLVCLSSESSYWEPGDSVVITSRTIKELESIFAKDGIKFLGWSAELPPICLVGPKIFRTFDDIKGLKVRAPGTAAKVIKSWGGTGVSIPASESYMALQRGVVDAAYTTIATVTSTRLWEVTKAITFGRVGGSPTPVCMNLKKWQSLPPDVQKAFEKVNREMPPWAYQHARAFVQKTEDFLKTKFKEHYKWSPEEAEKWSEPSRGYIWKPAVQKFGKPAQDLWDKILAVAKETAEARKQGKAPKFFE
jgi:TRAP-type C4-dicarboxylate transport system substrate-binding protein